MWRCGLVDGCTTSSAIMTSWHGNDLRIIGPLWWESADNMGIPPRTFVLHVSSDQALRQRVELVIRDAVTLMWNIIEISYEAESDEIAGNPVQNHHIVTLVPLLALCFTVHREPILFLYPSLGDQLSLSCPRKKASMKYKCCHYLGGKIQCRGAVWESTCHRYIQP